METNSDQPNHSNSETKSKKIFYILGIVFFALLIIVVFVEKIVPIIQEGAKATSETVQNATISPEVRAKETLGRYFALIEKGNFEEAQKMLPVFPDQESYENEKKTLQQRCNSVPVWKSKTKKKVFFIDKIKLMKNLPSLPNNLSYEPIYQQAKSNGYEVFIFTYSARSPAGFGEFTNKIYDDELMFVLKKDNNYYIFDPGGYFKPI